MTFKEFLDCLTVEERYYVEERAAIHEFDGGLDRATAERLAMEERAPKTYGPYELHGDGWYRLTPST